ncbi:Cell cycle checkpoint control protein rad9b, partial [Entomortierella chlamydospora]
MNQITQTTKSTINTIKAHALLAKALSNDPKPTPGYLFPEIARLTQSPGTSTVVLSQLLKTLTSSGGSSSSNSQAIGSTTGTTPTYTNSPHVLLKALKILRQLVQSGSVEFKTNLARRGKDILAKMVGYRGEWDEVHGDKFNEDVRTVAEDLLEYMHANPVQEQDDPDLTDREAAVLKNSTQDLQGFGNPEYDDSDSEDNMSQKNATRGKKKATAKATPPLPGFGNPAFEKDIDYTEPTLMSRLVDRLQEMTAPPPPMTMRAAHRQQEQRRQKLFVGEYSMRTDAHSRSKEGPIILMGTNPFKRTTRTQGLVAGGWGEKTVDSSGMSTQDYITSRVFPQYRSGTRSIQFRNPMAEAVYKLAQYIETGLVRSKFQSQLLTRDGDARSSDLMDTTASLPTHRDFSSETLLFWGTSKDISDVVLEHLASEKSATLVDHLGDDKPSNPSQRVSAMTGFVRDMIDWIEQEDWERRIRYLFVLDVLLAHPEIEGELLNCSALPMLSKTLAGPMCLEAPQRSVRVLSTQLESFQAVLTCLAKIGDDIVVEARPDRFILSTINITRSAFATFTFTRTFFESYHLDITAEAIKHDASGPYLRCTVLAKALVSACKIRGNVEQKIEKCCLFMNAAEGVGENCRLTVEIIFKYGKWEWNGNKNIREASDLRLNKHQRFIKIHKLLYESCPEPLQVIDSIESCPSSWRLPAISLIGFTENFSSKAEEITMTCTQEGITFKTFMDTSEEDSGGSK